MNPKVKKWLNRGGLIGMMICIAAITIGGGDADAAMETAGIVSGLVGVGLGIVRELLG